MKRVNSLYEISKYNYMTTLFIIILKQSLAIFSIIYGRKIFACISKKIKDIRESFISSLGDLLFLLINFIELIYISYIIHIISFWKLREKIFDFINFNFSTNSNVRDLNSFKILNCNEDHFIIHDDNNYKNSNEYNNILMIKNNLCRFENILDGFYFEISLIVIIGIFTVLKNFKYSYFTNSTMNFLHFDIKKILYVYLIIQIVYFSTIFFQINKIKNGTIDNYYFSNIVSNINLPNYGDYDKIQNVTEKISEIKTEKKASRKNIESFVEFIVKFIIEVISCLV